MKLSKLYTNLDELFEPINFNSKFNVVLATIKHPKDESKDSHNLGKSLLISVIDFCLLKNINKIPNHFLKKNPTLFQDFVFYLELELNDGRYVTIRRNIMSNTKISFKIHNEKHQNYTNLEEKDWDYYELPIEKSQTILNELINFDVNPKYDYRKGITYFLRKQEDYQDVFRISKFVQGKDEYWKPYLAGLFNFDEELIKKRFQIKSEIKSLTELRNKYEKESSTKIEEYDKLKSIIQVKESEANELEKELNSFSFKTRDDKVNEDLIKQVEPKIANLNEENYNLSYEIDKINFSLQRNIAFNIEEIRKLFNEVEINFNDNLVKSYEELLDFNKNILEERKKHLRETLKKLEIKKETNDKSLEALNYQRKEYMEILKEKDSFDKYKKLQKELIKQKSEVEKLKSKLENLMFVSRLNKEIEDLNDESDKLKDLITNNIDKSNEIATNIKSLFTQFIKKLLGLTAIIFTELNNQGNIEFKAEFLKDENTLETTSESDGHSYKKYLCMAFDLALLINYSSSSFYRFVYHDGALETLDNRKKIILIKLIREYCEKYNIQYILTLIDTDIPRDSDEKKINFDESDIVLKLNDDDEKGRLFKIQKF